MEIIKEILNMPVIIQGALGSFLFWLSFIIVRQALKLTLKLISKFNKNIKLELLLYDQSYSLLSILDKSDDSDAANSLRLGCLQMAAYRTLHGIIYMCLGLLSAPIIGVYSNLAYIFSIVYFFRALRVVRMSVTSENDIKWHTQRVKEIQKDVDELLK